MAPLLHLALLATIASLISPARACTTDEECSLNGVCTNNACVCDPGWVGSDCGRLDVQPGPRANGYNLTSEGTSSWCNGIIRDPEDKNLHHLFVSEFTHDCGLDYWSPYSRIIRAESTTGPIGPYTFKQEIVPRFAHNPTVVWSEAEQKYLLFNIGCPTHVPSGCQSMNFTCGPGNHLNGESGISAWSSDNLRDWEPHGQVLRGLNSKAWDADTTNPAPMHYRTGSDHSDAFILAYRGCKDNCYSTELINIATGPEYDGPYSRLHPQRPIFSEPSEDPFIWTDKRGNFHMLVHSLLPDAGFGSGPNVGRHAYSRQWNGPWTFNRQTVAFNTTVDFDDGSTIDYYRRERPNIFFSEDGNMTPLLLSTGVQEVNSSASYSLIQPIGHE
jgi:hypothetical protein